MAVDLSQFQESFFDESAEHVGTIEIRIAGVGATADGP